MIAFFYKHNGGIAMKKIIHSKKVRRFTGAAVATAIVVTPYVALAGGSHIG
jgi:hypothetical protein